MARYRTSAGKGDRATSLAAVILVHGALALALLSGLKVGTDAVEVERLKLFDIAEPPAPPPPEPPPPRPSERRKDEEGEAAKKANPTPVVAPEPKIPLPVKPPVAAAPVASTASAPTAGAAAAGSGTGAGGHGSGLGGGGSGEGGSGPRWLSGGLRDSDYPRAALSQRVTGVVGVRFTVQPNGRVSGCRVTRSSGSGELDATTCRLLEKRLRFVPARDARGRAVAAELGSDYTWGIRQRW